MQLIADIVAHAPQMQALRRDLHAHPELSFEEVRTAAIVAARLQEWGIPVTKGLAGTGVVGTLQRGSSSRALGLRADLDALPVQESNTFAHASRAPGRMHACGHDGHTAMLLAAAHHLAHRGKFEGTVHFIFQPAEERGGGARQLLEAGLFERFPCDAVFGLHNWPGLPYGRFAVRAGALMAGTTGFEIDVQGRGAHAAMPHLGIDALLVGCHIALGLQLLVTRERDPRDAAVLSITQLHAGAASNVIAGTALLKGTLRTFDDAVLERLEAGIRRVPEQTAAAHGADATVRVQRNYPPLVNDVEATRVAAEVMASVVGPDAVDRDAAPTFAAEDFAFLLQQRPGCYALIGNDSVATTSAAAAPPCLLHSDRYDFNDELIPLGATYWVRLAERFLAPPGHFDERTA